jgi:hypothetical protein
VPHSPTQAPKTLDRSSTMSTRGQGNTSGVREVGRCVWPCVRIHRAGWRFCKAVSWEMFVGRSCGRRSRVGIADQAISLAKRKGKRAMISKENASIPVLLACLALLAVVFGLWVTRPASMDLWASLSALVVIYIIVAGGPQILIFAAAAASARQGQVLAAAWWSVANLVFLLQVGAGAMFLAGAILGEERLLEAAAAVLVLAALSAVAATMGASRIGWQKSDPGRGS